MSRWVIALTMLGACGKVEKIQPDAPYLDAHVDAPPDALVQPITNGSFEHNYDGWSLKEDSGVAASGFWGISGNTTFVAGATVHDYADNIDGSPSCFNVGTSTVMVADGMFAAFNAQSGPDRHRIYQDIYIPTNAKMLTWSMAWSTNAAAFDATNQYLAIEMRNPTSDAVIGNLFITDPTTNPPLTQAMTAETASLQPYLGQFVRFTVDVQAQSNCLFTVVDNFQVTF